MGINPKLYFLIGDVGEVGHEEVYTNASNQEWFFGLIVRSYEKGYTLPIGLKETFVAFQVTLCF